MLRHWSSHWAHWPLLDKHATFNWHCVGLKQTNACSYKAASYFWFRQEKSKQIEGGQRLCAATQFVCVRSPGSDTGPRYYPMEAKLCPTVKLIAATVCRTVLWFIQSPHVTATAEQTKTRLTSGRIQHTHTCFLKALILSVNAQNLRVTI
jgi:hypothetical protein